MDVTKFSFGKLPQTLGRSGYTPTDAFRDRIVAVYVDGVAARSLEVEADSLEAHKFILLIESGTTRKS